jgi:subtilisin family serine protease
MMRTRWIIVALLLAGIAVTPVAGAQQPRLIVRDTLGAAHLTVLCPILGCKLLQGIGDPKGQVFQVVSTGLVGIDKLLQLLQIQLGIVDVELDQLVSLVTPTLSFIPDALADNTLVSYYGSPVWHGYIHQPANLIVRTADTQSHFHLSGAGVVAMIDTGLDPQHPALAPVVLPGYDFTRNSAGADEKADLDHSTAAVLDGNPGGTPLYVDPWLAAVVSNSAAAALSNPKYAAFGHGTMTAGIVHMVAPTAKILPLKAFSSDGTGYASDILRAIYFATAQGSKVISMSFSLSSSSSEMASAVNYAATQGVICVASAGNDGRKIMVYPASLNNVMGVASTSDTDTQSSFSNYGSQVVWVAAPGENIISTYPYGTYASSSGTSFSAPFVSGTAALLVGVNPNINSSAAANAIGNAKYLSPDLNHGRLDTYLAVGALNQ